MSDVEQLTKTSTEVKNLYVQSIFIRTKYHCCHFQQSACFQLGFYGSSLDNKRIHLPSAFPTLKHLLLLMMSPAGVFSAADVTWLPDDTHQASTFFTWHHWTAQAPRWCNLEKSFILKQMLIKRVNFNCIHMEIYSKLNPWKQNLGSFFPKLNQ